MSYSENVDANELNKFSSHSSQWWDTQGEFKTLHDINPLRLNYIQRYATLENKTVVDIGCGGGLLTEAMCQSGAAVYGIDASEENIRIAKQHAIDNQLEIDYSVITAESFALQKPAYFDAVSCMELLEHVPDPASLIQACASLVKPGGYVFVSTLNRSLKSYLLAVLAGEYLLKLLPKGTHDYQKFIRPSELHQFCQEAGLRIKDISGVNYNPAFGRATLSDRPDVNYILAAVAD